MSVKSVSFANTNYLIGYEALITSDNNGGNIPTYPNPLVSGNTYNLVSNVPLRGAGSYLINWFIGIEGDNTTVIEDIYLQFDLTGNGFYFSEETVLINTTLPNSNEIRLTGTSPVNAVAADTTLAVTLNANFTGTAPTITSTRGIRFFKIG